jgi:hypothetical protein
MPWVESVSPSFRARHGGADADAADRVLHSLERLRDRLERVFPRTVSDLTVVFHSRPASLAMAHPVFPLAWAATAPAARRYVAGWAGERELHVLTPEALVARAAAVPGSREMLQLTPEALYARWVIAECNPDLPAAPTPRRVSLELRWAWLLEGAARWFAGQIEHARPTLARRLREGVRPDFPPGARDAVLLGGTVIDLLAREEGEQAAARLACRLHPQGPRAALDRAFGGRALVHTEGAWRTHLARLAGESPSAASRRRRARR